MLIPAQTFLSLPSALIDTFAALPNLGSDQSSNETTHVTNMIGRLDRQKYADDLEDDQETQKAPAGELSLVLSLLGQEYEGELFPIKD